MKIYKLFSYIFLILVPLSIGFVTFYEGQETKVAWSFGGIFLLILIFLSYYGKYKSWYKIKKQSHETARNLGYVSQSTNFVLLGLSNFFFNSIPFYILILLEIALNNYSGNISVHVGYVILSLLISQFFDIIYNYTEQANIKEKQSKEVREATEKLAENIKSRI